MIPVKDQVFLMLFGAFLSPPWPGDGPPASPSAHFCDFHAPCEGQITSTPCSNGAHGERWEPKADKKPGSNTELQEAAVKAIK